MIVIALFSIDYFYAMLPFTRDLKAFVILYLITSLSIVAASILVRLVNNIFSRISPIILSQSKP
jgi:hypothetical protein